MEVEPGRQRRKDTHSTGRGRVRPCFTSRACASPHTATQRPAAQGHIPSGAACSCSLTARASRLYDFRREYSRADCETTRCHHDMHMHMYMCMCMCDTPKRTAVGTFYPLVRTTSRSGDAVRDQNRKASRREVTKSRFDDKSRLGGEARAAGGARVVPCPAQRHPAPGTVSRPDGPTAIKM